MPTMNILDRTGDTRISWDPSNEDEVSAARATFTKLKKKGYLAYVVSDEDGGCGRALAAFDADAKRIILTPPVVGG